MAFAFFRRRQKMVIVIMVVLMVSFLIGFQGFEMVTHWRRGVPVVGTTRDGRITIEDRTRAETDLFILDSLQIRSYDYLYLRNNGEQAVQAYTLLLREADALGPDVTGADVEQFFAQAGISGSDYDALMSQFRARHGVIEAQVVQAVRGWIKVVKTLHACVISSPPSESELRLFYRDLFEKIDPRVARLKAEDFLVGVKEPADAEVRAQFEAFRDVRPGTYMDVDSFGFGYRQPARVRMQYVLLRKDVLERLARPGEKETARHWRQHQKEYVKTAADTQPASATAPSGAATTQPGEREIQMTFEEALPRIVAQLTAEAVETRMERLSRDVERRLAERALAGMSAEESYDKLKAEMALTAAEAMDKKLPVVQIVNQRLDRAMEMLAEQAGLAAICFPWGRHGDKALSPTVSVTVTGENITVGQVLQQIAAQVKWPQMEWAMCADFEKVLFPVSGVDFFPISVRTTGPLDESAFLSDPVLGAAFTAPKGGKPLAQIAFAAKELVEGPDAHSLVSAGQEGPPMHVRGDTPGRLLWRLLEAEPAHRPEKLTDEIAQQVGRDLKLQAAFKKAVQRAEELRKEAQSDGLKAAAEKAKLTTSLTGLLARRDMQFNWSEIPEISLPVAETAEMTERLRRNLIERVFSLAPADVEPPYAGRPPVAVIPAPPVREVLVVERADFRPAVASEFEKGGRAFLAQYLTSFRMWQARANWFNWRNVEQRLAYKPQEKQG